MHFDFRFLGIPFIVSRYTTRKAPPSGLLSANVSVTVLLPDYATQKQGYVFSNIFMYLYT